MENLVCSFRPCQHNPGGVATETSLRLETSDIETRVYNILGTTNSGYILKSTNLTFHICQEIIFRFQY